MFDLKKSEKLLLKCLDAADVATQKKSDDTYFRIIIPPGYSFPVNKEINDHIMGALIEISRNEPVKTNLPEKYIREEVENILMVVFNQPKEQRRDLLNDNLTEFREIIKKKLKDEIKDYEFTLQVNRLLLEEDIVIGEVSFFKYNENKGNEINSDEIEKEYSFLRNMMGGPATFLKEGNTYAEVKATGVQDYAYSLALYKVRLALNIIKLFSRPDYCVFGLVGESLDLIYRTSVLVTDSKEPRLRRELVGGHPEYFLNKQVLDFMEEHGLNELNNILKKESKLTEYENRLLTGIYWYGEAVSVIASDEKVGDGKRTNSIENFEFFNRGEKLLKLFTALESVLIFSDKEQITQNIAERTAMIIAEDYENRLNIKKRLIKIYNDRSKTVHQGLTYVSKNDLSWLTDCVRGVLFRLIELKTENEFNNKEELRTYIEKHKLS